MEAHLGVDQGQALHLASRHRQTGDLEVVVEGNRLRKRRPQHPQ